MKLFLTYLFIPNQLYNVSGDVFAHHLEYMTVFTASDIVHRYCNNNNIGGHYQKL